MDFLLPPGISGISHFCKELQYLICSWSAEEHFSIHNEVKILIDEIDPAVVVLGTMFIPAIEATRERNLRYAVITPNQVIDNFITEQPYGSIFWKFPAMASGFPYPLPWEKIPENLNLNARVIYSVMRMPELAAKRHCRQPDYSKAPTVMINLGSTVMYTEAQASVMMQAIAKVLDQLNVQFLWKFNKHSNYSNKGFLPVQGCLESDQLRLERWLTVDPTSILETGLVVASVHHGGANCYNEALYVGVPQIIMPLWADLYNYAVLVESIGIGVWTCPKTSPDWTVDELALAILKVVDREEASVSMWNKARELGDRI